jgi:HK97 family phage portal protein
MIAEAAASIPLILYQGANEHDTHPLLDLLARPAPGQTGTDLLEAWYGYLLVAGNAYLEVVELNGKPRELHALRPDRMTIIPGQTGWPEAFEYTASGGTVRFPVQSSDGISHSPILHVRLFHPLDDHYGFSPIEALRIHRHRNRHPQSSLQMEQGPPR